MELQQYIQQAFSNRELLKDNTYEQAVREVIEEVLWAIPYEESCKRMVAVMKEKRSVRTVRSFQ